MTARDTTELPPEPITREGTAWSWVLVHLAFGLLVLVALFMTVHNRRLDTTHFEERWSGIFPDRWGRLADLWVEEGYWRHGGLWRLDRDEWFQQGVADGGASQWFDPATYEPDAPHYYRSNSALFVLPIAGAKAVGRLLGGEGEQRFTVVLTSQLVVMVGAALVGLLAGRLALLAGADSRASLVLGLSAQLVFQTNPLNLAAYWDLCPQHVFIAPLCLFLIGLTDPGSRRSSVLRIVGVAGMTAVDVPHAAIALGSWAVSSWLLRAEELRGRRLAATVLPAIAVIAVVALQFLVARWMHPDARFLGSGILSRTGLDGDVASQSGVLDGFVRLIRGPVLYGGGRAGTDPLFWSAALAVPFVALILAAVRPRLRPTALPIAVALGTFGGFVLVFSNAFAIHPYVYPVLLLVASIPALFGVLFGAIEGGIGRPRIFALIAIALAITSSLAALRAFAVHFPVGAGERLIGPPSAADRTSTAVALVE